MDSLQKLSQIPIQGVATGEAISLGDIASISKGTVEPPASLALIDGSRAVVAGVLVRDDMRIDHWSDRMKAVVEEFGRRLPAGIEVELVFNQSSYVERSLWRLLASLAQGTIAVVAVVFVLMGWRSTLVVGMALPLSALKASA